MSASASRVGEPRTKNSGSRPFQLVPGGIVHLVSVSCRNAIHVRAKNISLSANIVPPGPCQSNVNTPSMAALSSRAQASTRLHFQILRAVLDQQKDSNTPACDRCRQ